ncbi:hypothetical protein [Anditalea andensis]|uniref:PepSY domain-containing protein n=1 Tax=Anditalea andensis TaxID=1048983 RepID=A0A074KZH0_9BACT|nr:hypothetical protein [Anditalea andensis]KEO75391.1 hypothetical protein EL17_01480 [Anditalea andensis]
MKKLMLICAFGVFGLTAVNAQQTTPQQQQQRTQTQQEGTRVAPENLPQPVRDAISKHRDDKDARVVSANQKTKDGKLMYELTFQKDDKTYSKKYDAQGKEIDKDKKDD